MNIQLGKWLKTSKFGGKLLFPIKNKGANFMVFGTFGKGWNYKVDLDFVLRYTLTNTEAELIDE